MTDHRGELYRPANGAEGMAFMEDLCWKCEKYRDFDGCDIQAATMAWKVGDPDYPREWIYGPDGLPTCTAFREEK